MLVYENMLYIFVVLKWIRPSYLSPKLPKPKLHFQISRFLVTPNKIRYLIFSLLYSFCIIVIIISTEYRLQKEQWISLVGYFAIPLSIYATSIDRRRVKFQPVFGGILLQILLGIFILKTKLGFNIFNVVGNVMQTFLNYVDAGSSFVFGPDFNDHGFAFKVLMIVIYSEYNPKSGIWYFKNF